ncbi:hypothetical protein F4824DRAFT_510690 [Ustulina deusta]|nr:hypothetical protein F4824DRAFT_510690 [Ustulina deusta]
MHYYEYEFWQCGHITRIEDGFPVSENGDLSQPPLLDTPLRLRDIRTLLSECNSGNEAVQMAERRVTALKNFLSDDSRERFSITSNSEFGNLPTEFSEVEHHVVQLEFAAVDTAARDFAAAHRRLRSRIAQSFISSIVGIRADALYQMQFRNCNDAAKECLFEIIKETKAMTQEIKGNEEVELRHLADLDVKAADLRRLLNEYAPGIGERYEGSLGRPSSEES